MNATIKRWIIILLSMVVIGIGLYYYFITHTPEARTAALVTKVGKLMLLPSEQPIVAELRQADILRKQQGFYADVEDGDTLFIFPKVARAIIYRSSRNLIINAGPFSFEGAGTIHTASVGSTTQVVPIQ